MRRWSGRVRGFDIELVLTLQCFDDNNHRLSRTLSSATDQVCESLATSLVSTFETNTSPFLWLTDSAGVASVNAAITGANNEASHFFVQHRLRMESLFSYISHQPTRGMAHARYL